MWKLLILPLALPLFGADWARVTELHAGDRLEIALKNGDTLKGTFAAAGPDSITLDTRSNAATIARNDVRKLRVRSPERRLRNALIGAAIGTAVGLTIDQTLGKRLRNESSGDGGRAITYAAAIGGITALLAAPTPWRTAYETGK